MGDDHPRHADVASQYQSDPDAVRINAFMSAIHYNYEPRKDFNVTEEEFIDWLHRNHNMISTDFGRRQHNAVKEKVKEIIKKTKENPNPNLPTIEKMETILQLLDRQPVEEAKASAASETPSAQAAIRLTKLISEKCNAAELKQAMDDLTILIDAANRNKGGSRRRASKKHSKKSKKSKKTKSWRH
jgi:hypothetical protein